MVATIEIIAAGKISMEIFAGYFDGHPVAGI
jgi:hypothetical protein